MKFLCIIPARKDSKGIPGKNWKTLNGKPLISYSYESALNLIQLNREYRNITLCVSTNAEEIRDLLKNHYGYSLPFFRPENISEAQSTTVEVIRHAIDYYASNNQTFDAIILLQPTSPYRKLEDIDACITLFEKNQCEMVVSVTESPYNPYYNIYLENSKGYIARSIPSNFTRRQDCPKAYLINGSVYVIKVDALYQKEIHEMEAVLKYEMDAKYSVDLDTENDWRQAEKIASMLTSHD